MAKRPFPMAAYEDCLAHFEMALAAEHGLKITCPSHGSAMSLRLRMNKLRHAIREQNSAIYPPGDKRHGVTPFDSLELSIDATALVINKKKILRIQEL